MKILILSLLLIKSGITATLHIRFADILEAYGRNETLLTSSDRNTIQWHQCGRQPDLPLNGEAVICHENKCFAICQKGKLQNALGTFSPAVPYI